MNTIYRLRADIKSNKTVDFVLAYWLEVVTYKGEKKERYKYMPNNSNVRRVYDQILSEFEIDKSYCRFFNVNEKTTLGRSLNEFENIMLFYGLKSKQIIENQSLSNIDSLEEEMNFQIAA
jgi:hypothetical protein